MKILNYILSIYILSLTLIACADEPPKLDDSQANVQLVDNHDHDHPSGDEDHCSPLCVCHCCHAHYYLQPSVTFKALTKVLPTYTEQIVDFKSMLIQDFLKPPIA